MLRRFCLLALLTSLASSVVAGPAYANEKALTQPAAARWPSLVRLPPIVGSSNQVEGTPTQDVDGTWRQEGSFLIINLNGQQLRLANTSLQTSVDTAPTQVEGNAGEVYGQLSHRNQPLNGCEVVLVPLRKTWAGYQMANRRNEKLLTTTTNATGTYHFASVPAGQYKLKWRPAGEKSWVRRAENRPDVHVRANKTSTVKAIRVALRTIN